MSNYNFSMAVLYTVCRLAWQNCLNNVAVFAARKGFYNAAYIALRMGEIDAAEALPDEQARDDAHETLRIQLKIKNDALRKRKERLLARLEIKGLVMLKAWLNKRGIMRLSQNGQMEGF